MTIPEIRKVILEPAARNYPLAAQVLGRLGGPPVSTDPAFYGTNGYDISSDRASAVQRDMGKDVLHLIRFSGAFLKPCPGTREYICCGYQILNLATNCPLDCSYCVLQAYINQPNLRVFVNYEEALQQSLDAIDAQPERVFRVGTGEFTDSLALDPLTGWTHSLVSAFSRRKNAVLELKTKTTAIKGVLASEQRDRIILSWSLNSPYIVSREEHGAPGLRKRLEAARTCQREGFVLGFHFDPLIPHRGWRDGYLRTMELLDRYIDPRGIIWISLGALRFMPALKSIIRLRHPHTTILDGEFITGLDGKRRYFKPIRMDLYGFLRENLEAWHSDLGLYLCMESDDVWKKSMGWSPTDNQGLGQYLDARVGLIFGGHD